MREIKFRAWDFDSNKMLSDVDAKKYLWNTNLNEIIEATSNHCHLMQYTGLKDKNGVEIYDGDILKWYEGEIAKVVWYDGDCTYEAEEISGLNFGYFTTKPILNGLKSSMTPYYEVIGNIYENKELLN